MPLIDRPRAYGMSGFAASSDGGSQLPAPLKVSLVSNWAQAQTTAPASHEMISGWAASLADRLSAITEQEGRSSVVICHARRDVASGAVLEELRGSGRLFVGWPRYNEQNDTYTDFRLIPLPKIMVKAVKYIALVEEQADYVGSFDLRARINDRVLFCGVALDKVREPYLV